MFVYIGTYSGGQSKGIYVYQFDAATGRLEFTGQTTESQNPSFLALHPSGRYLYAVNEVGEVNGKKGGGVSAYAIDAQSGGLTFLNQQSSRGDGPCHLTVDATGLLVVVANYGGGSVAALPIQQADGRLGEATSFFQHEGKGPNPARQGEPHAHSVTIDGANSRVVAADLGIDKLLVYRLDLANNRLLPNAVPFSAVHAGAGPRHFAFHPSQRFGYVINELDSTISTLAYDAQSGALRELGQVSTLPADFKGASSCADIHIAPGGRFLYGSNRGHNSIAIFSIDANTGLLMPVGHELTQGRTPRNFALDPMGRYLLAANQDSGNIAVFGIDAATGRLSATGQTVEVPSPVCIKFHPLHP